MCMYIKMTWLAIIVVIVVVIAIIVLTILHYYSSIPSSKQLQIRSSIQELHKIINDICYRCETPITYRLIVDDISSFVEVSDDYVHNIHLVVWNEQYKRPYNLNSLLLVVLLELSAVTGLTQLLSIAQQLGYYDVTAIIEDIPGMRVKS